jgi:hypothetical protein
MSSAWPRLDQRLGTASQRALLAELTGYGQARGWAPATMIRARRGLTVLLAAHPAVADQAMDPAAVRAFLLQRRQVALRVTEFLTDQGMLGAADPGQAVLDGWLASRLEGLPTPIRIETQTWIEVLRGRGPRPGPASPPPSRAMCALQAPLADWAVRYQSLRQVTTQDLTAQLDPVTGPTRLLVLAAMRSLFATLKARRVLFANPTAGLIGRHATPTPALELDPAVRASLLARIGSPNERLIVLLAGVHALRSAQICTLTLDAVDPAASALLVDRQPRCLDALTRTQARAWLELRRQRWPHTANPYLLVNRSTAGGVKPVKRSYVQAVFQRLGLTAQQLRVDRLLAEAHATGGDPLALTRLFGLSDPTAIRYCAELDPPSKGPRERPTALGYGELSLRL